MAVYQHFFDDDGCPTDIGEEVNIQFIVVDCIHTDSKGKPYLYPRVILRLKHELNGQEFEMDGNNYPQGYAPSCIISRNS